MTTAHVLCPLCQTPCRCEALVCDVCEQPLDRAPDLAALETERRQLSVRIALAALAAGAVAVASLLLFRGVGFFVVIPGAWLGSGLVRYRELSKVLRANQPTSF